MHRHLEHATYACVVPGMQCPDTTRVSCAAEIRIFVDSPLPKPFAVGTRGRRQATSLCGARGTLHIDHWQRTPHSQRAGSQDRHKVRGMDCRFGAARPDPASFVPPKPLRDPRELVRYRRKLLQAQASKRNRLKRLLEIANIKLANVVRDVRSSNAQGADL